MPRKGRIGLFGTKTKRTKKFQPTPDEAEDLIAQLFEQELDFPDFSDDLTEEEPTKSSQSTSTTTKSSKSSKAKLSNSQSAKSSKSTKVSSKAKTPKSKPVKSKTKTKSKAKKSTLSPAKSILVQGYTELTEALSAHCPLITLTDNIIASDNILINYDVTINFNGFSIISGESHSLARVLDIRSGKVTLAGPGKIFAMGKQGIAIRVFGAISSGVPNYTNLTIDQGISLFAPDSYGILISPNLGVAYGLTINFSGQIFAHDGIGLAGAIRANDRNLPTINIQNGAHIVADEQNGVAVEAAGYGIWQISNARLSGAAAASLIAGEIKFDHAQALAKDITFSLCASDSQDLKITIDGGTYVAERGANIAGESSQTTKLFLRSGNFYAPELLLAKSLKTLLKSKGKAKFSKNLTKILAELAPASEILTRDLTSTPAAEPTLEQPSLNGSSANQLPLDSSSTIEPSSEAQPTSPSSPRTQPTSVQSQPAPEVPEETRPSTSPLSPEVTPTATPSSIQPSAEPLSTPEPTPTIPQPSSAVETRPVITQSSRQPASITESRLSISPNFANITPSFTTPPPVPSPTPTLNEQDAARMALADAINDIRKLNSEDYGADFALLEQIIQRAELVLNDPRTTLQDIFATASELLQAFDGLQQSDDFSLSDDELDELFYHGAVLEEMVGEPQDEFTNAVLHLGDPKTPRPNATISTKPLSSADLSPADVANQLSLQAQTYDAAEAAATDFGKMTELLNLIAELDLNRYLTASQTTLLEALAETEEILNDPTCSQEEIDDITERITDGLRELELVRLAHLTGRSRHHQPKINIPAPTVHQPIPIIMIDEMTPSANWSTGVTMIDEMTPYVADADTLEKMIRATKPVVTAFFETIASPLKKLSRSVAAGARAGIEVYRETLHAAKN